MGLPPTTYDDKQKKQVFLLYLQYLGGLYHEVKACNNKLHRQLKLITVLSLHVCKNLLRCLNLSLDAMEHLVLLR